MPYKIIVLSGQVCAGKTTLASTLRERYPGVVHVKTSDCIKALLPDAPQERKAMQEAGEKLDARTGGNWVLEALHKHCGAGLSTDRELVVVLDSVRIQGQIEAVRRGFGNRVLHVHLEASISTLADRYAARASDGIQELSSYEKVMENPTEAQVPGLGALADVAISSERCTPLDIALRTAAHAGLFGKEYHRAVDVLVGGQYGSEGKGQIAAFLAPEYDVLVRTGGPNAGHRVWQDPDPVVFQHLPSGTNANPNARIVLAAGAVIRVPDLLQEIARSEVEADRLTIDPQAMVIGDADIAAEQELQQKMGSTGKGVGFASARRIQDRHLQRNECTIAGNHPDLKPYVRPALDVLDEHFRRKSAVMLEGTQGTGLSLFHGDYPYVTSRDTTVAGCLAEAGVSPSRVRKAVMVCRTYPIRVESPKGFTSGPMSNEMESWKTISERSGVPLEELEATEKTTNTKRKRRVGEFDWCLLRRSASLNAPTDIALTFVDYLSITNRTASRMDQLTPETIRFVEEVERIAMAPVSLLSVRFHSRGVIDRRHW